jgi:hypothetical protein
MPSEMLIIEAFYMLADKEELVIDPLCKMMELILSIDNGLLS